ncbi:DnaJ domain-containing protein [Sphingomonas arenae]|uniref:DnaJ domain-containing protein n=1 Tax=Sphingomonas arenae TaxID=2812555 RepID=UPI0019688188
MGDVASAYAVLGLGPGADRKAVEDAYRRLMKRHHPDREGGDPNRAAEINDAYALLRGDTATPSPIQLRKRRARKRTLFWLPVVIVAAVLSAALWWLPRDTGAARILSAGPSGSAAVPLAPQTPGPPSSVDEDAISAAVDQAVAYAEAQKWKDAEGYAATCAADFARLGGRSLLDHCVAFERAFALLQGGAQDKPTDYSAAADALMGTHVLGQARIRMAARRAEDRLARGQP